jgi:hypothetical protein
MRRTRTVIKCESKCKERTRRAFVNVERAFVNVERAFVNVERAFVNVERAFVNVEVEHGQTLATL